MAYKNCAHPAIWVAQKNRSIIDFCRMAFRGVWEKMPKLLHLSGFMTATCFLALPFNSLADEFSVQHGVEAEWYVSSNGAVLLGGNDEAGYLSAGKYSPSGENAFFIVKSANLERNQSELTLFLVSLEQDSFTVSEMITLTSETNSPPMYASRWMSEDTIALIGEYNAGQRQILTISLEGEIESHYSEPSEYGGLDVGSGFDIQGETVVYGTPVSKSKLDLSEVENGYVVGDKTLSELAGVTFVPLRPVHYFVSYKGKSKRLNGVSNPTSYIEPVISISPDGQFVILTTSPQKVPSDWLEYPILDKSVKAGDPAGPLLAKLSLVNLATGEIFELTDAPMSNPTELNQVIWDVERRRVILIDQFISPQNAAQLPSLAEPRKPHTVEFSLDSMKITKVIGVSPVPTVGQLGDELNPVFDPVLKTLSITRGDSVSAYTETNAGWRHVENVNPFPENTTFRLEVMQSVSEPSKLVAFIDGKDENAVLIHETNREISKKLNPARLYKWSDVIGRDWSAALTLPKSFVEGSQVPLVIQSHTFSPNEFVITGTRGSSAGFAAQSLASEGFAVLNMGFQSPGITQSEKEFEVQAAGYRSAIKALSDDGIINPKQVGIASWSRSGFWMQKAISDDGDLFAAALASDASSFGQWAYLFHHNWWDSWKNIFLKETKVPPFGEGLSQWKLRDPVTKVNSFQTPLLITAYGEGRHMPLWWESYVAMKEAGEPVEYFLLPNTPHNPVQPRHKEILQSLSIDWFNFWILGIQDSSDSKVEQYVRWNQLLEERCSLPNAKSKAYCSR